MSALQSLTNEDLNSHLSTYEADHCLAASVLKQSADEIDVALMALGGEAEPTVRSLLTAVVLRMRFVADIVAADDAQEASR